MLTLRPIRRTCEPIRLIALPLLFQRDCSRIRIQKIQLKSNRRKENRRTETKPNEGKTHTMNHNPLANVLSKVLNAEQRGKKECIVNPTSGLIKEVLRVLNEEGFVGTFEEVTPARGGVLNLPLLGNINACGVISPRFSVTLERYEKFEKRYLPAKGVGILVVSTSKGIMTHDQAKEKLMGGRLLAYCY